MSSGAEITGIVAIGKYVLGGTITACTAVLAWFLSRLIKQNDDNHKDSRERITALNATVELLKSDVNSLKSSDTINKKKIKEVEDRVNEIAEISQQIQKGIEIEEAIKKRDELEALKKLARSKDVPQK